MRSLLKTAANDWGWIKAAPVIKTKKPISKRIRWLTREEAERLIACMPESIKPVVIFALATGLRRSNIIDLEWQQVDMQKGCMGKSGEREGGQGYRRGSE
jgi:integrase